MFEVRLTLTIFMKQKGFNKIYIFWGPIHWFKLWHIIYFFILSIEKIKLKEEIFIEEIKLRILNNFSSYY